MRFIFEQIRVGGDRNFGYLLGDREAGVGLLIDPSYAPEAVVERAQAQGLKVTHILNTHGHPDHTNGNEVAKALTGALIAGGPKHPGPVDVTLRDGDGVSFGEYTLRVWHVPGHYPDHLAFLVEGQDAAFTGDLLFVGKVGGTQTEAEGRTEWQSLQRLLKVWPDTTTLWPGHDYGARPSSTLAWEKRNNPFLLCADVEAFLAAKRGWAGFKARHGLR
ncbi:hydroxyacylglutathione hydrolase family protein [Geothrix sp. PMB-07]|uniref:hydroxyacylglutathione hydrolase family protein n=1 Tax=Geothrix sp. PMB-07 TaxID=3068640 RepID=UPI00274067EB|nr:hydroxyacylglutathione hydrolase family protein [Geothrix sp. PMB-07]WLT32685.1 hydroxyacylglutathione hydrolase family protein [Geothrix sp. PMB-07]